MVRVVVTVSAPSLSALTREAADAAEGPADVVELRLDALDDLGALDRDDLAASLRRIVRDLGEQGCEVLVTLRSTAEGGGPDLPADRRADLLSAAVDAGPAWVDLEPGDIDEGPDADLVRRARRRAVRVVASRHLPEPAESGDLLAHLEAALARGADVAKVACPTDGSGGVAALLDAARTAKRRGWPYALMGLDDPVLRALAPSLGMALVYAAPGEGREAAPGQLPADLMAGLVAAQSRPDPLRLAGLVGGDVGASPSPAMHNAAFAALDVPAVYLPLSVGADDLQATVEALRVLPFAGVNVTIPHKEAVVDLLDRLDPSAKAVGAVNTVEVAGSDLVGHNTDVHGVRAALDEVRQRLGGSLPDGPALVLGAGGAARACVVALGEGPDARAVRVANRTPDRAEAVAADLGAEAAFALTDEALAEAADGAAVVINATPVAPQVPWDRVADGAVALDLVYRPRVTAFLADARKAGLATATGDRVLLHQAARAFEVWTGKEAPLAAMDDALARAGADRERRPEAGP